MEIETQIRGKEKFYYLKQSIRKRSKIKTKRKYLGKKIPKNIEKIKEEFYREINKQLFEKLEKIKDNFQKELKKLPKSVKQREFEEIAISFTYNTNAIEGSTISLSETRDIVQNNIAPNKKIDDLKETQNHVKVFYEMLNETKIPNSKIYVNWHYKIFKDTKEDIAGKLRNYLVGVGKYIAPEPEDMNKLIKELDTYMKKTNINPVEFAGRVHYIFEKIHPFGDGNGRVGRLLMNYVLWRTNYPMLIIEYKNRKAYYNALEKSEQKFSEYFIKLYLRTHKNRYEK